MTAKKSNITVFSLLIFALCACKADKTEATQKKLTLAFISHTYYVNRFADMRDMVVEQINSAEPDYVFALGDIVFYNKDREWSRTLSYFKRINAPIFYSPGNHDIFDFDIVEGLGTDRFYPKWRKEYIARIGYVHKLVQDPLADFILVNSNDPFEKIQPFLDESLSRANPDTPTILMTHHPIWLDRIKNNWVHWYWKSAQKSDFEPYIKKVDQLVIGDVWGRLENLEVFGVPTTRIGMGNNDKPAFWVLATIDGNGKISFEQKTLKISEDHPYIYKKK